MDIPFDIKIFNWIYESGKYLLPLLLYCFSVKKLPAAPVCCRIALASSKTGTQCYSKAGSPTAILKKGDPDE